MELKAKSFSCLQFSFGFGLLFSADYIELSLSPVVYLPRELWIERSVLPQGDALCVHRENYFRCFV